jgi:hypothetical protein
VPRGELKGRVGKVQGRLPRPCNIEANHNIDRKVDIQISELSFFVLGCICSLLKFCSPHQRRGVELCFQHRASFMKKIKWILCWQNSTMTTLLICIDPLHMKQNYQDCTDYLFFEPHPPAAPAADAKASICALDNGYPRPLLISLVLFNFEALLGID